MAATSSLAWSGSRAGSPQYPVTCTPCSVANSSRKSSNPPISGPPHSCTDTIPSDAAASRAARRACARPAAENAPRA
ncbi:Uncharacterised protein [Mycobacteroides abscessus subsp. abscessus]|nr:Uncharacterised protein [Mycobacteroides abscessus subsp. abscessus]